MFDRIVDWAGWVLLVPAAGVALCATVFAAEVTLAAVLGVRKRRTPGLGGGEKSGAADGSGSRARTAVVIPAHNEEAGLGATLAGVRAQLAEGDVVVVVADNCRDGTAGVARAGGARVLERTDAVRRGKGYALDAGVRELERLVGAGEIAEPGVVVIVDADCTLGEGCLGALSRRVGTSGDPAQAVYLMKPAAGEGVRAGVKDRVSALAFLFKNQVRPIGLDWLGGPCLLTGTGMALTWGQARRARLASGNIVEDMQLGIDLAIDGTPPRVAADAMVFSELPSEERAKGTQRTRWEHGHLRSLVKHGVPLFVRGLRRGRLDLVLLALELMVPPLSLLVMVSVALVVLTGVVALVGGSLSGLVVSVYACGAVLVSFVLGWARYGRKVVPARELAGIGWYVASKVPIYVAALFKRQTAWVRTARAGEGEGGREG
jgi:cellulose synthase/poly-beta-1,6-N-acetylglucosamine synthase-like glycosyltransferase